MKTSSNRVLALAAWFARILPPGVMRALYRIGPLASLLRGILNQAAPDELEVVEVAGGDLQGTRLLLHLKTEKDYWLGSYEAQLQAAIRELVEPGMVAFDVGGNIGYTGLLLAQRIGADGSVFSFEALPDNLDRMRKNVAMNNLQDQVHIVPAAVVDKDEPVQFFQGASSSIGQAAGSAGRLLEAEAVLEVTGVSLDSFVYDRENPAPDIIKMDIEGGEVRALPGARQLLERSGPNILLELHGPESAQAAWEILSDCGYRIYKMEPGFPEIDDLEDLDWKAYIVALK